MNGMPDIDSQFWVAVQENDPFAFERIFRKYYKALCGYVLGILGDEGQAEDVVQEVFIYFWEHREELKVENSLRAYLYTSVRHRALKLLQKQALIQKHSSKLTEFVEYMLSTEYTFEEEKAISKMKEVLQELPQQCLKVFLMSNLEEKKYSEIADELGISINTVKSHITKAYRVIRQQIPLDLSTILLLFGIRMTKENK